MNSSNSTTLQNVVFWPGEESDKAFLYLDQQKSAHYSQSRHGLTIAPQGQVSLASYFNAFPASYWRHHTGLEEVLLKVVTSGKGTISVWFSNSLGKLEKFEIVPVSEKRAETFFTLPLTGFEEGGWYWFDLSAGSEEFILESASWLTAAKPVTPGKLSLAITTYNKVSYCINTLKNLALDTNLLEHIDQIFVVDQGSQKLQDSDDFEIVQEIHANRLKIIEQPNLGGSGGFSRGMAETLKRDPSDFVMLLDDDVELETESIFRALQFARFTKKPALVGGHMFDLLDKPIMHAWAETVQPEAFNWGPSFPEQYRHDFRIGSLRETAWMHKRLQADYNGWWMCLIPKKVIEEIGLSIPVFIKWDDSEYGLRAAAAGYETVSLPGVGLWHISWLDKDDTQDWQAFFHTRNRIIAGLIHSEKPAGGGLLINSGRQDIKKLLNMQYYAVQLAVNGLKAVLDGPENLHQSVGQDMPAARAVMKNFPETNLYEIGDDALPKPKHGRVKLSGAINPQGPRGIKLAIFTLSHLPRQWLRNDSENKPAQPALEYPKAEANWWKLPKHRSVLVEAADGSGIYWFKHDKAKFRRLLKESRKLTRKIKKNWPELQKQYREALPHLTSVSEWQKTFDGR